MHIQFCFGSLIFTYLSIIYAVDGTKEINVETTDSYKERQDNSISDDKIPGKVFLT